jgi:peroxiredoxin Q/BCP
MVPEDCESKAGGSRFTDHMKKALLIFVIIVGGLMITVFADSGLLPRVGTPAPQFEGTLSSGNSFSLKDFKGEKSVVLYFYPKDFTSGCTQQACSLRDNYADISALGAAIFGVSSDDDSSHTRFSSAYNLPFPLISDPSKRIASLYGVTRWGGLLPSRRVTFVIDREGIIRSVIHHELRIGKHVEEILSALKALR